MTTFEREGPIAVLAVSAEGAVLAECVGERLRRATGREPLTPWTPWSSAPEGRTIQGSLPEFIGSIWHDHAAIVGVMASGIMVRAIAPWIESKLTDPAVVVADDAGRFVISLLSGHEGGANSLAELIAGLIGGVAVVTTGTEARRRIVAGIGARRGVTCEGVLAAIDLALEGSGYSRADIRALSTIDLKADEPGIQEAARTLGVPLWMVSHSRIRFLQEALREPNFVESTIGVAAVCIPAALLPGPEMELLGPRLVSGGVTVALALDVCGSSASARAEGSI
ncbi:MAG: cobalamin biosynthesis protein [Thermoleophilia bacterium]|nr:cobalamin biosynthesis protein [Thermoleophilia bacterium]